MSSLPNHNYNSNDGGGRIAAGGVIQSLQEHLTTQSSSASVAVADIAPLISNTLFHNYTKLQNTSEKPYVSTLCTDILVTKSHVFPFSEDLLRILKEVAMKGSSTGLPWHQDVGRRPMTTAVAGAISAPTTAAAASKTSISSHDGTRRNHDYHGQTRRSGGSGGGHKRARMSTIPSSRHRSHYSSASGNGRNSATTSSTTTTTMTTTMVVEPKSVSSMLKHFPNGTHATQQTGGTTASNLFMLRSQALTSSHPTATTYQNGLFSISGTSSSNMGRTTTTASTNNTAATASGSEHEDTSQYECDSEGTSATSNSEVSFNSINMSKHRGGLLQPRVGSIVGSRGNLSFTNANRSSDQVLRPQYMSVRDALGSALSLVLDHYFHNRGGYKLSPLEKRVCDVGKKEDVAVMTTLNDPLTDESKLASDAAWVQSSEEVFKKRKTRLLDMLGRICSSTTDSNQENSDVEKGLTIVGSGIRCRSSSNLTILPPFTIQRVAEVLMEPERYYTQTHKLCNCLEKLLLVTSSVNAFGSSIGENTTHSRQQEEIESVALSEERKRLRSEFRHRHRKSRRMSNLTVPNTNEHTMKGSIDVVDDNTAINPPIIESYIPDADADDDDDDDDELLEQTSSIFDSRDAAARATLRSKFDHVGIDPHSQTAIANSRDVMALIESRRMTNSNSPPLVSHNGGLQLLPHQRQSSPSRSSPSPSSSPETSRAMLSPRVPSPLLFHNNTVYDAMLTLSPPMAPTLSHPIGMPFPQQQQHHSNALTTVGNPSFSHLSLPSAMMNQSPREGGGDSGGSSVENHRSSPASSDFDSESDFDDSASDRSDGSDNEMNRTSVYEPLTAAQAMALNRRHQQARMQSRLQISATTSQMQQQQQQQLPGLTTTTVSTNSTNGSTNTTSATIYSGIMDGYNHRPVISQTAASTTTTTESLSLIDNPNNSNNNKNGSSSCDNQESGVSK